MQLTHHDHYRIKDIVKNKTSPFIGLVRVYENGVLNTDQTEDGWLTNMTIGKGREFANQALFKMHTLTSTLGDISEHKIDHFGIGSGGSSVGANNEITLLGPSVCDEDLYIPTMLNTTCIANSSGNVNVVKKITSTITGILPGMIGQEISTDLEFTDCPLYYTITKCTCIVEPTEPTALNPGDITKIDEAVLYATDSNDQNPIPFAHICFAPKFMEKEGTLTIEWYIIF